MKPTVSTYQTRFANCTVIALLAGAIFAPPQAASQSCCSATAANDFGVVGRCNYAMVAGELRYLHGLSSFDTRGKVHSLKHATYGDATLRLGAGLRMPYSDIQIHGQLPMNVQYRQLGSQSGHVGAGVGDAALALRWTVINDTTDGIDTADTKSWKPFVDLFVGAKAPTGHTPDDSVDITSADVTGNGVWEWSAGLKLSKYLTGNHVLQLMGQYALRGARDIAYANDAPDDSLAEFTPGNLITTQLAWVQIDSIFWSWGVSANLQLTTEVRQKTRSTTPSSPWQKIDDSQTRRLRLAAFVTHALRYPELDITISLSLDPPINGFATNIPFTGASLGVKLAYNTLDKVF